MTGQNFILGTLTGINAMALPITVMHFNVYSVIERGNDDLNDFYIGIFDPKGEAIVKAGIQIADWGAGIAENNMPLPGLMFKIEGDYSVQLFVEGHMSFRAEVCRANSATTSEEPVAEGPTT